MCMCMCTCTFVCMCVCLYVHMCTCTCVFVCMCVYVSLSLSLCSGVGCWQNHRTETEHAYGLTRKLAVFSMLVSYTATWLLACVYVPHHHALARRWGPWLYAGDDNDGEGSATVIGPERIGRHVATVLITGQIIGFVREVRTHRPSL
jgi:hypothetical protein